MGHRIAGWSGSHRTMETVADLLFRRIPLFLIVFRHFFAMTHLDRLENQSIFLFREAHHAFKNIAMPWSMGKDSNVLIWLAKKAFGGFIPFPLLHIDTTYEFPEMLQFRDWATQEYGLKLIIKI